MSILWADNMRGPRVQMHVSGLLLLLLLLLSGLTHTVFCQEEEEASDVEATTVGTELPGSETTPVPGEIDDQTAEGDEEEGSVEPDTISTVEPTPEVPSSTEEESFDPLLIVIPVVLLVLIIIITVCCMFIRHRLNSNIEHSEVSKEDQYLDGSSTEKVPMPMFEEDVPSVLELEMEDLDGWIKKDGELSDHNQKA